MATLLVFYGKPEFSQGHTILISIYCCDTRPNTVAMIQNTITMICCHEILCSIFLLVGDAVCSHSTECVLDSEFMGDTQV